MPATHPVTITVRGSFDAFHRPERATVHIAVAVEAADRESAYRRAADTSADLQHRIGALHDAEHGPVTWWSADQLRTSSRRPWNQEGRQLPLVHVAALDLQVKFADFARLDEFLAAVAPLDDASVTHVEWDLTEARRRELTEQARIRAVDDARSKAATYAGSVGLSAIRPVAIADVGMLGEHDTPPVDGGGRGFRAAAMAAPGVDPQVNLAPEDIRISAAVDARFVAD